MAAESSKTAQRFVMHGNFAVMPLCFPSVTVPIDPDESYVTAIALHSDGVRLIGGTSGRRAHLFEAAPKPVGGYVCDLGGVDGAAETVRVLARGHRAVGCVNASAGGRVVLQWVTHGVNGIQEWSKPRPEAETLTDLPGERLRDGWIEPGGKWILLLTDRRVLRASLEGCQMAAEAGRARGERPKQIEPREAEALSGGNVHGACVSRFAVTAEGEVYAALRGGSLFRIDTVGGRIEETGVRLPFSTQGWGWATSADGRLIAADEEGRMFALDVRAPVRTARRRDLRAKRVEELGRTVVAPVKCVACLADGRAYGFCGEGIGRFFLLDIHRKTVTDLGAVAGVLGAKRYANTFSCAVAAPDGEIYLGEDDRGGHLWIYFPPVVVR